MEFVFTVCFMMFVLGRVEYPQTCLTLPHTLCASPKPGPCNPVDVIVFMFKVSSHFIFGAFYNLPPVGKMCPLLETLGQPVEVCIVAY